GRVCRAHGRLVAHVEGGRMHASAPMPVHELLQSIGTATAGDHPPAAGNEAFHAGGAEPGGGAGDPDGLAGHAVTSLPSGRWPGCRRRPASAWSPTIRSPS